MPSPEKIRQKIIEEQLSNGRGKLRFKRSSDVVSGNRNLHNMEHLKNRGNIKRLLNEFMRTGFSPVEGIKSHQQSVSALPY